MIAFGETGVEELEVVVNLGEGADGGAGGANLILLFDRDRRWNMIDAIDKGLVHAIKELSHVGREGFYVAALALGIKGVEGERGLSRARGTGYDR